MSALVLSRNSGFFPQFKSTLGRIKELLELKGLKLYIKKNVHATLDANLIYFCCLDQSCTSGNICNLQISSAEELVGRNNDKEYRRTQ